MSIHADIVTATTAVAGGRVYPTKLPVTPVYPCIVYARVGGAPVSTFLGDDPLDQAIFQFDIFTEEAGGGVILAWSTYDSLRDALEASSTLTTRTLSTRDVGFEEGTEPDLYHVSCDIQIWRCE